MLVISARLGIFFFLTGFRLNQENERSWIFKLLLRLCWTLLSAAAVGSEQHLTSRSSAFCHFLQKLENFHLSSGGVWCLSPAGVWALCRPCWSSARWIIHQRCDCDNLQCLFLGRMKKQLVWIRNERPPNWSASLQFNSQQASEWQLQYSFPQCQCFSAVNNINKLTFEHQRLLS